MRSVLAALMSLIVTPTLAAASQANVPAELFSPLLIQGWQIQPKMPPEDEALGLALAWSSPIPNQRFVTNGESVDELLSRAQHFGHSGLTVASHGRSTVGQTPSR